MNIIADFSLGHDLQDRIHYPPVTMLRGRSTHRMLSDSLLVSWRLTEKPSYDLECSGLGSVASRVMPTYCLVTGPMPTNMHVMLLRTSTPCRTVDKSSWPETAWSAAVFSKAVTLVLKEPLPCFRSICA